MIELRPYQLDISERAYNKVLSHGMVYLSMEVRTGKTFTALNVCKLLKGSNQFFKVLFVTKKKAIQDIQGQCDAIGVDYATVINYESLHKLDDASYDVVVLDEAHGLGQYPKPSNRYKNIRTILNDSFASVIFLSGTPSPESYSQLFHQFNVSSKHSPFKEYKNFYKWAVDFVNVTKKYVSYGSPTNDYSDAIKPKIDEVLKDYFISYSQVDAGFENKVNEEVLTVKMKEITYKLCDKLIKDDVIVGKSQVILADTPVKKQSKLHQLYSGTIKFEDGSTKIIDNSKALFIKDYFNGKKIAIFYKFIAEFELLKSVFDNYTTEPTEFKSNNNLVFLGQIQSVREGINLSSGDCLVMFNIDFSAVSYWQGRDRMSEKNRQKENKVYWIFSDGGIEQKIYRVVKSKQNYTKSYFENDFGKQAAKQNNKGTGKQGILFA